MQMSFRSTVRSMQDPGYVGGVKGSCYILHAILQGCTNIILIHKVTFKKFICHVRGVEGSVHIHE